MIKKDDIGQLLQEWSNVSQWLKAHISTKSPPHRYEGDLAIEGQCLVFRGRDIKEVRDFKEVIPFNKIYKVLLAFDERLQDNIDLSFGIGGPVPLIIRYQSDNGEQVAYLNTSFNNSRVRTANRNREWYETLDELVNDTLAWDWKKKRQSEPAPCLA